VNSVSIDLPKKLIDQLSTENRFMLWITWDSIFITKSPQIFSPAVRCDHFGAILAVHFTIKQNPPLIQFMLQSSTNLSRFLSRSLSNSVSLSLLGQSNKEKEEIMRILIVSLVSPSSSLLLYFSISLSALPTDKKEKK